METHKKANFSLYLDDLIAKEIKDYCYINDIRYTNFIEKIIEDHYKEYFLDKKSNLNLK